MSYKSCLQTKRHQNDEPRELVTIGTRVGVHTSGTVQAIVLILIVTSTDVLFTVEALEARRADTTELEKRGASGMAGTTWERERKGRRKFEKTRNRKKKRRKHRPF
jgi:hypothetical protein